MITPFDDYPIHQTPLPIAQPVGGDRNHYDRFFFNGYDPDGEWFFGVAMGLYPNRGVIDAAFSIVHDGVQRSVFASGRAPLDRTQTRVGPIAIEVVEPLRANRVVVTAAHLGIEADLRWEPRTPAIEEPRQTLLDGTLVVMDTSRLVQWGTWNGSITVDGARIDVDAGRARGTKDRSWGIRPVGEPSGGAPSSGMPGGGLFWLWAPVHFADRCTHLALFEHPDGHRWYESAGAVPLLDGEPYGVEPRHATVEHAIEFRPGTRRARRTTLRYRYRDGGSDALHLEPILDFQLKGLGYFHADWAHGWWRGEIAEGADAWKLDEIDPLDPTFLHVQQLCRVRRGDERGVGVFEQLILGPHAPSGFAGFLDGAPG